MSRRRPPRNIRPQFQVSTDLVTDTTGAFNSSLVRDVPLPVNATTDQLDNIPLSSVNGFKENALPWYEDQVLPFDITIAAANEYGSAASCKIFGVEILNSGFGTSVDDSVLEQQATFVARSVLPLPQFYDQIRERPGAMPGPKANPARVSDRHDLDQGVSQSSGERHGNRL